MDHLGAIEVVSGSLCLIPGLSLTVICNEEIKLDLKATVGMVLIILITAFVIYKVARFFMVDD